MFETPFFATSANVGEDGTINNKYRKSRERDMEKWRRSDVGSVISVLKKKRVRFPRQGGVGTRSPEEIVDQ